MDIWSKRQICVCFHCFVIILYSDSILSRRQAVRRGAAACSSAEPGRRSRTRDRPLHRVRPTPQAGGGRWQITASNLVAPVGRSTQPRTDELRLRGCVKGWGWREWVHVQMEGCMNDGWAMNEGLAKHDVTSSRSFIVRLSYSNHSSFSHHSSFRIRC